MRSSVPGEPVRHGPSVAATVDTLRSTIRSIPAGSMRGSSTVRTQSSSLVDSPSGDRLRPAEDTEWSEESALQLGDNTGTRPKSALRRRSSATTPVT